MRERRGDERRSGHATPVVVVTADTLDRCGVALALVLLAAAGPPPADSAAAADAAAPLWLAARRMPGGTSTPGDSCGESAGVCCVCGPPVVAAVEVAPCAFLL